MRSQLETRSVSIPIRTGMMQGDLNTAAGYRGLVLFAHGSGSSRHSPRNKYVAQVLNRAGFSTLLLDLLTADEEVVDQRTSHLRFDIELLATRLIAATDWIGSQPESKPQHLGYFGASTGAAAALVAAARRTKVIEAIVSRGGRPDLAASSLSLVRAPTLFIVGEYDDVVIDLNRQAANQLRALNRTEIVPRATHLFEERGALERVAELARDWFEEHLFRSKADVA